MMIPPESYAETLAAMSLEELLAERDSLMSSVRRFERRGAEEGECLIDPAPDVVYQMELLYLAKACEAASEAFSRKEGFEDAEDA